MSSNPAKLDPVVKDAAECPIRRGSRWVDEPSIIVEVNMTPSPVPLDGRRLSCLGKPLAARPTFFQRYLGIMFGLLSSIVFSLSTVIIKVLNPHYHPFNLGIWRFLGILAPSVLIVLYNQLFDKKSHIFASVLPISKPGAKKTCFLLLLRVVLGCTAVIFQFYALQYISVADASVIGFSTPIVITVLAYFVLHEAFSVVQILTSVISLIGVFIIARPPFLTGSEEFDTDTLIGTGMSLGCMAFTSIVFICLRFLRESHYLLITLTFGIWGTGQCLVMALAIGEFRLPDDLMDWAMGASLALLTFIGQTFITLALKYEQSGVISLVRCLDVVFAFIYQFIFLGTQPDLFSVIGALLVVLSVAIIGVRKWMTELPEEHPNRRRFWILLK